MLFGAIRNLVQRKAKPPRKTGTPQRKFSYRPHLDGLEDRLAPANFAVAPTGTDGAGFGTAAAPFRTIQFAVNAAQSGDTILVAAGTYTYNPATDISSQQPPLGIGATAAVVVFNKQLNIFGGFSTSDFNTQNIAANPTIISGNNQVRGVLVVSTAAPTSLRLEGFTITNGLGTPSNNNLLSGDERIFAFGGGMFVDGAATVIRNVSFQNNQSIGSNTNSGVHGGNGSGGGLAIRNSPGGSVNVVENTSFVSNAARGGVGPQLGGFGIGGGMFVFASVVNATNVTFTNNLAQAGATAGPGESAAGFQDGLGGGLAVGTSATVTMVNVTATGNRAQGGDAANGNAGAGFGGALYAELGSLIVQGANIRDNVAQGGNGLSANANTVPAGLAEGGGVHGQNANVSIDRASIINNVAQGGSGTTFNTTAGGGGVALVRLTGNTTINVTNTIVAANQARMGNGNSNILGGGGGGFFLQGVTGNLTHVTIAQNSLNNFAMQGSGMLSLAAPAPGTPTNVNFNFGIMSDHSTSGNIAALQVQQNNSVTINRALFANNTKDSNAGAGPPQPAGNIAGLGTVITTASAGYVSPGAPNFNYKLANTSQAVNQAQGSSTSVDIDNLARAGTFDLGADELDSSQGGGGGGGGGGGTTPLPTNDNSRFVTGLYHDALGRASDAGGLAFFQRPLDEAMLQVRTQIGIGYAASPEHRGKYTRDFYQRFLRRTASDGDATFWVSALNSGITVEQEQAFILGSGEYFQKAGSTNDKFVSQVYNDVLKRNPDPSSANFVNALNAGTISRDGVAGLIASSAEARNLFITDVYTLLERAPVQGDLNFWRGVLAGASAAGQANQHEKVIGSILGSDEFFNVRNNGSINSFVNSMYQKLLGRAADPGGFNFALNSILGSYATIRTNIVAIIVTSDEYRGNLVKGFYKTLLGRDADQPSLNFWVAQYKAGATDEQIIARLVASAEYIGSRDNAAWLNKLYMDVLKRERGAGESFFLNILNSNQATKEQVAAAIMNTDEYRATVIRGYYTKYLARTAGDGDLTFWVSVLRQGVRNEQALAMIISSAEYYLLPHMFP